MTEQCHHFGRRKLRLEEFIREGIDRVVDRSLKICLGEIGIVEGAASEIRSGKYRAGEIRLREMSVADLTIQKRSRF